MFVVRAMHVDIDEIPRSILERSIALFCPALLFAIIMPSIGSPESFDHERDCILLNVYVTLRRAIRLEQSHRSTIMLFSMQISSSGFASDKHYMHVLFKTRVDYVRSSSHGWSGHVSLTCRGIFVSVNFVSHHFRRCTEISCDVRQLNPRALLPAFSFLLILSLRYSPFFHSIIGTLERCSWLPVSASRD